MKNLHNFLYNMFGGLLPLAVTLLTVPIFLKVFGAERYGLHIMISILVGYLGLFDLGLGRAITFRLSKFGDRTTDSAVVTVRTALAMALILGSLGGGLLFSGLVFADLGVLGVDSGLAGELRRVSVLIGILIPITTSSSVLGGVLIASERFAAFNIMIVLSTISFQLLPLAGSLFLEPDMTTIVLGVFTSNLLNLGMLLFLTRGTVLRRANSLFSRIEARHLLGFGGWMTVTAIASPLMTSADRYVISAIVGLKAVTTYTIPYQISQKLTLVANSVSNLLFPKFSRGNVEVNTRAADVSQDVLSVVSVIAVGTIVFTAEWFLGLWISKDFAEQAVLAASLLAAGFGINILAFVPFTFIQGSGRPKTTSIIHLVELPFYILMLIFLVKYFGVEGAAAAFLIRVAIDTMIMTSVSKNDALSLRRLIAPFALNATVLLGAVAKMYSPTYFWPLASVWGVFALLYIVSLALRHRYLMSDFRRKPDRRAG